MPRSSDQNQERRQESRQRIIQAATGVFVRAGYSGARMAEIARAAGISHGLIFHYFPNKEAIFLAVVQTTMGYARARASSAVTESGSAIGKLRHLCSWMLDGARDNSAYTALMFQTSSNAAVPEAAREALQLASSEVFMAMAELIADAQRAGDIGSDDPKMLARTLIATLSGIALSVATAPDLAGAFPTVEVVLRVLGQPQAPG